MKNYSSSICSHFSICSGCQVDLKNPVPLIWDEALRFFEEIGVNKPLLHQGSSTGWRCRAKLAVRGKIGHPLIGLFKEGSHETIEIPFCQVHHPHLNRAVEFIRKWMITHQLEPYQEESGKGDLRYLQLVLERQTGKVQASFVLNLPACSDQHVSHWLELLKDLGRQHNEFWHSLWINFNDQKTNTIFSQNWHLIWGEEWLWECFGKTWICYQPANFAQANLDLFEQMLEHLKTFIPPQSNVTELYAGVGVIGLFLIDHCAWVRCAELNPHAEKCFEKSRARLPAHLASRASFHTGSAQQLMQIIEGANSVIVDPPRKGLDKAVVQKIQTTSSIDQLIYVSCGWQAFKKDAQKLLEKGWQLSQVDGYLFFPGTNQIEILANFKR